MSYAGRETHPAEPSAELPSRRTVSRTLSFKLLACCEMLSRTSRPDAGANSIPSPTPTPSPSRNVPAFEVQRSLPRRASARRSRRSAASSNFPRAVSVQSPTRLLTLRAASSRWSGPIRANPAPNSSFSSCLALSLIVFCWLPSEAAHHSGESARMDSPGWQEFLVAPFHII